MRYRIIELVYPDDIGELRIQRKRLLWWSTIWMRRFQLSDRDYALQCAEELKEHLEAEI